MSTISNVPKISYIYDEPSDTWYPMAGIANTAGNYIWEGNHTFDNPVAFLDAVTARNGLNNFLNPTARDAAIPSPLNGSVCFVRQNNAGTPINELQYYNNGWINLLSGKAAAATLADSATVLATARTINGVSFNGSANIKVPVVTYVDSSNNLIAHRRIFVKNSTTPPTGAIDGASPQPGDLYFGW